MPRPFRRSLMVFLLLLIPVSWWSMRFDPYAIDGDAVAYMDIADLLHAHRWAAAVDGYWHPLYPAFLAAGQVLLHPLRIEELGAYYAVNWVIFWMQVGAVLLFCAALVRLRERTAGEVGAGFALSTGAMRLLSVGLLTIAAVRELTFGKVRPDGLLQAFFLLGFAFLLRALAADSLPAAALMGVCFGLAYLTKSFAFVLGLLSIVVLVVALWKLRGVRLMRALTMGAVSLVCFAVVAGPFVVALSKQKHRFDFGDSGNLNYAWFVGGTEKMHLEPSMTSSFGTATVHLLHPEKQLMATPGVYGYGNFANGTYPPWFDPTYFNERIVPHVRVRDLLRRDGRNVVLIVRYLFNHPEPLVLLLVLVFAGFRVRWRGLRANWFVLPAMVLGVATWALYGMVNIEERYVTVGYFAMLLPLFAALRHKEDAQERGWMAPGLVVLLAFLSLGSMLRIALQERRDESVARLPHGWYSPEIYGAAEGLRAMGVQPGAEIACVGTTACLTDHYWARLAGVRILTEIYAPEARHLTEQMDAWPNRAAVYDVVRGQGAQVLVGNFDAGAMTAAHPSAAGWVRLGETNFYALPLDSKRTQPLP